jgi:hypothetical protein
MHKSFGPAPTIKKVGPRSYDIQIKYSKKFCPIGGKSNPKQAKVIQDNICYPYVKSFLHALFPDHQFEADIKQCILANNHKYCHYILNVKVKDT